MANAVVVYYSLFGHTATAAKTISDHLKSPIYRIEEKKPRKGLFGIIRGTFEGIGGVLPEIKPVELNESYDIIFLGGPIWALGPAPAMNSFIQDTNLKGKQIILFLTHTSGNPKQTVKALAGKIHAKGGKVIRAFGIKTLFIKNETIVKEALKISEAAG